MISQYVVLSLLCLINSTIARRGGGVSIGRSSGSSYPVSHGLSGTNTRGYGYPRASSAHTYPHSSGLSGNTYSSHSNSYTHKTEVHNHYHYTQPQHISYGSVQHPVYHGTPPVYIYQYRDSGSRFDNLLTGLALYNLGRMSSHEHRDYYNREYRGRSGEICKLGISKTNGEYEESRIDCKVMSSFIWDAERDQNSAKSTSNVVTTVVNSTQIFKGGNSSETIVIQNTTVVDALQVKGPSIQISSGMNCFMIRISRDSSVLKKKVECGLLQEYATSSLRYNNCIRILPSISVLISILIWAVL